jgi:hypothetical protein
MPDPTVPTPRPSIVGEVTDLAAAHATVTRDRSTGVVSVAIGSVDARVVLADDPAVLHALASDVIAQIEAIAAG